MVYSEKFYIGFSDVGPDLGITNSGILKLFENVCCLQGEAVGDGIGDSDGRWFLTAYHVKIAERPKYPRRVNVSTWSRGMKGFSAAREFEIRDESGRLLVSALSNWARINSKTGRLERMPEEDFRRYESEPERANFPEMWLQKLHGAPGAASSREFFVDRNMIDSNRHLNNVHYLDLAVLALPEEVYLEGEASEFEITYRKATAYGETVICEYFEDGAGRFVAVKSKQDGDIRAVIKFSK